MDSVKSIAFSPRQNFLATISHSDGLYIWDIDTSIQHPYLRSNYSDAVAFHPDGSLIATNNRENILLVNVNTYSEISQLPNNGHEYYFEELAFSSNGAFLGITGHDATNSSYDSFVQVWKLADEEELFFSRFSGHPGVASPIVFNPINTQFAFTSGVNQTSPFYTTTPVELRLHVWDIQQNEEVFSVLKPPTTNVNWISAFTGMVWTPQNNIIITSDNSGLIQFWNAQTGELGYELVKGSLFIRAIALHPNGNLLATAGENGTIRLWGIPSLEN